jgi:hypothetical protein
MTRKRQKWIAAFVALTFIWLMQASTMPAAAAGTTAQVCSAGAEQGPDYLEAAGQKADPAAKKSILPIILIGVGVVAVTAFLFLVVLKTKYDLRGTWSLTRSSDFSWIVNPRTFVFVGSARDMGTLTVTGFPDNGPWTVDGKDVHFTMTTTGAYLWTFDGTFTDKDTLSGTLNYQDNHLNINGTWSATRSSAE